MWTLRVSCGLCNLAQFYLDQRILDNIHLGQQYAVHRPVLVNQSHRAFRVALPFKCANMNDLHNIDLLHGTGLKVLRKWFFHAASIPQDLYRRIYTTRGKRVDSLGLNALRSCYALGMAENRPATRADHEIVPHVDKNTDTSYAKLTL